MSRGHCLTARTSSLLFAFFVALSGCGLGELGGGEDSESTIEDPVRQVMVSGCSNGEKHGVRCHHPAGSGPWTHVLTVYGGPSDASAYLKQVACGGKRPNGRWWYATGAYPFGCGARLEIRANGKCVVVKVVDNGPATWVERKAQARCGVGVILDTSPMVSRHLFGVSSSGWSDCRRIQVRQVSSSTPTGPCSTKSDRGNSNSGSGSSSGPKSCFHGGIRGVCQPASTACKGRYIKNLCYGSSAVQCCMPKSSSLGSGSSGSGSSGSGSSGSWGGCRYRGVSGRCQQTSQSCPGSYRSGLCPGPSSVKCCLPPSLGSSSGSGSSSWGRCRYGRKSGTCQSTSRSCSGRYRSGLCPGPNSIKCCLR